MCKIMFSSFSGSSPDAVGLYISICVHVHQGLHISVTYLRFMEPCEYIRFMEPCEYNIHKARLKNQIGMLRKYGSQLVHLGLLDYSTASPDYIQAPGWHAVCS